MLSVLLLGCQASVENHPTLEYETILVSDSEVEQAIARSIQSLISIDPLLFHDAWTWSMENLSDEGCPLMEEHNGMDLWRNSCVTQEGTAFLGWTLNLRDEDIRTEDGANWWYYDWLSGQAQIKTSEVTVQNFGDILHQEGLNRDGNYELRGLVYGDFRWDDPSAINTWVYQNWLLEYEYRFVDDPTGRHAWIQAWISQFDASNIAVIWDDVFFDSSLCALEPSQGSIWVRSQEVWVEVLFDLDCDGCGYRADDSSAEICMDSRGLMDWETHPWEGQ